MRSLPTVIGPTENALRALLRHTLGPTGIATYEQWVVLNVLDAGGEPSAMFDGAWGELRRRHLVDGADLTDAGRAALAHGRRLVAARTATLVDGIDDADLATTVRVLDVVRERAEAALTAPPGPPSIR